MNKLRILNALPKPEYCDSCASPNVEYLTNDVLYGRIYGTWPYVYFCRDCKAAVGCHDKTEIPLGRMADTDTRRLRAQCHSEFDKLWKTGIMSRSYAYRWLASELSISVEDCHISWLSKDQITLAIEKVCQYHGSNEQLAVRRNVRRSKRSDKQRERDRKRGRNTVW